MHSLASSVGLRSGEHQSRQAVLILSLFGNAVRGCAHPRNPYDECDRDAREQHAHCSNHRMKCDARDEGGDECHRNCSTFGLTVHTHFSAIHVPRRSTRSSGKWAWENNAL